MASSPLVLPGVLFVGEDDRARVVAHLGPAAGWFVPRGIKAWSTEVSVVAREALTEDIRRTTKAVLPEEQIPPAKFPLTLEAARKSPLLAVSSKLTSKLVDAGVRVHTIGADAITSSFYYLAEGGGEEPARADGDLIAAVGAALGESDNAALEVAMEGVADRLLHAVSKGRVTELTLELAAALPRVASDGSGLSEIDLDRFEHALAQLTGASEKYRAQAQEIADRLGAGGGRVPLFTEAKKLTAAPISLAMGASTIALPAYDRWTMANALGAVPDAGEAERAAAEAAARKAAEEKAAAERAAAAEAKRASEEAAAKKAAEEKAAAEKAAAEAAARKAADERVAAEAAARKAAESQIAAEAANKKAGEEKAAADKKAAEEQADLEKKAADEAAAKKAAEEKAAAATTAKTAKADASSSEKKKKATAEKAEEKAAAAADGKSERPKDGAAKKPAGKAAALAKAEPEKSGSSTWVMLIAAAAVGAAIWRFFLH